MITRRALWAALALAGACRRGGAGFAGRAYVSSGEEAALVTVDLKRFVVTARTTLAAPAGTLLAYGGRVLALSSTAPLLEVLDAVSLKRTASIRLPAPAIAAMVRRGVLWCLLQDTAQILPVELAALRKRQGLALPGRPVAFDIARESLTACIGLEGGVVAFAALEERIVHPPRLLEDRVGQVRFRSDGRVAVAAGLERRQLIVLDTATRQVMTQLPLAVRPERFCMSADGGQLFITGEGRDAVVIAYLYRTEIAQTSLSGRKPAEMAACSAPPFLFVSNPEAGSVTVFDIANQKAVAMTGVGLGPGPIYITPDEQFALVLNRVSGDMAVIRIPAIQPGKNKRAPLFTMIPVGPRPETAVIAED